MTYAQPLDKSTLPAIVAPAGALRALAVDAVALADHAKAANTVRAIDTGRDRWLAFCERHGLQADPTPANVELFLTELKNAGRKRATLNQALWAVKQYASEFGIAINEQVDEPLKSVWAGLRRTTSGKVTKKRALLPEDLRKLLAVADEQHPVARLRDRALVLLGFAAALRRSELVALDIPDLEFVDEGMLVHIGRSKGDQAGEGETIAVPHASDPDLCPVRAVREWLQALAEIGIRSSAVFRATVGGEIALTRLSDASVARAVKSLAKRAGLPFEDFSGHSLRRGLMTSAALKKVPMEVMMRQSRHKSVRVAQGYIDEAERFRLNAAGAVL